MKTPWIRPCCVASFVILVSAHVLFADEDTVARFVSEAPEAWEEAIEFQDRLEGRYTKTMIILPSERMLYSVEGEYKCMGRA